MMDTRKKLLAVALIAALAGGVVGAFAFRAPGSETSAAVPAREWQAPYTDSAAQVDNSKDYTGSDRLVYNDGYTDGLQAARLGAQPLNGVSTVTRTRYAHSNYSYVQPRQRSFWDKHRDKLTMAMGAGGGALIGGLIGGKRGAGIGLLAGGGGSALYTYKIRKRNRRY